MMLETIKNLEKGNLKHKLGSIIYNFVSRQNCVGINIYIDSIDIFFKHNNKTYQIGSVSPTENKLYINCIEVNGGDITSFELIDLEESVVDNIYIDLTKQIYISCSVYHKLDRILYCSMAKYICNFTTKNDDWFLGFSSTTNNNSFKVVIKRHTPPNVIRTGNKHHGYPMVMDVFSKKNHSYVSTESFWDLINYMFKCKDVKSSKLETITNKIEKFNKIMDEFINVIRYETLDNILYDYKKYLDYLVLRYYNGSYEDFVRELDFKMDGNFVR